MSHTVAKSSCPHCRSEMDRAANVTNKNEIVEEYPPPSCGDITMCINCGNFLEYDRSLNLIHLKAPIKSLDKDAQNILSKMKKAWEETVKRMKH